MTKASKATRKRKAKFRVGQVVFDKTCDIYERVGSYSFPHKSYGGYYILNHQPERDFRPLTRREKGD